jgi:ribosomal protein S18 acetylase RimI-like enzyme
VEKSPFTIRQGTATDAPLIAAQRLAMFEDMGYTDDQGALQAASSAFDAWLAEKLRKNEYLSWFALNAEGEAIAGVGLVLQDMQPGPLDCSTQRGYVLNVYTHPNYRRLGLARQLMTVLMDWCRAQGLKTVVLHASDAGRPLYASLGFRQTNEMRIRFEKAD